MRSFLSNFTRTVLLWIVIIVISIQRNAIAGFRLRPGRPRRTHSVDRPTH